MKLKQILTLLIIIISITEGNAQQVDKPSEWFIVLPLRFTHLQANNTMLSGVKVGKRINNSFSASVSIYHSFYLRNFRTEANINGFDDKPRLFIYTVGGELDYYFFQTRKFSLVGYLLVGWGFLGYETEENNFSTDSVNFFALEPTIGVEYKVGKKSYLGVGIGYRPFLGESDIKYSSDISSGFIPVRRNLPNGFNLLLSYKGFY